MKRAAMSKDGDSRFTLLPVNVYECAFIRYNVGRHRPMGEEGIATK
jgi:hypothetical protein